MKKTIVLNILIMSLYLLNCKDKSDIKTDFIHKLQFVNDAGYIKLTLDSILNDTYLEFEPSCVSASWVHVIKNKNMPGYKKIDSLFSVHNDSICYLLISYLYGYISITPLEELDSIQSILDSKLSNNRPKRSFIENFGKNDFVIISDFITDQNSLPIDSSIASYQSISATNNINIKFISNMYNVEQFHTRFRKILQTIEFKLDRTKHTIIQNNIDSFLCTFNKENQFN